MSFLSALFRSGRAESVVLIDVSANSVAGAYARYTDGETPSLLYARRIPVEARKEGPPEEAVLQTLQTLGEMLIREGAPILARAAGSGSAQAVLVSIDAPWQGTSVRTEQFEEEKPFIFTRNMVISSLQKSAVVPPEKFLADESIIGTILNGYETGDPYGKRVRRASVIVLTSLIDKRAVEGVVGALRGLFHTRQVQPIASSSLRFQAMRAAFPHEHDALIIDAIGPSVSLALLRKNLFVALAEVADSAKGGHPWIQKVGDELAKLSKQYPLPRTIFLLARETDAPALREALGSADLGKHWLSDNPPALVTVLPSHLAGLVRQAVAEPADLPLLLMALYWNHRARTENL